MPPGTASAHRPLPDTEAVCFWLNVLSYSCPENGDIRLSSREQHRTKCLGNNIKILIDPKRNSTAPLSQEHSLLCTQRSPNNVRTDLCWPLSSFKCSQQQTYAGFTRVASNTSHGFHLATSDSEPGKLGMLEKWDWCFLWIKSRGWKYSFIYLDDAPVKVAFSTHKYYLTMYLQNWEVTCSLVAFLSISIFN